MEESEEKVKFPKHGYVCQDLTCAEFGCIMLPDASPVSKIAAINAEADFWFSVVQEIARGECDDPVDVARKAIHEDTKRKRLEARARGGK